MKYLTFMRHSESYRETSPPPALMEPMGRFVQRSFEVFDLTLFQLPKGVLPCE